MTITKKRFWLAFPGLIALLFFFSPVLFAQAGSATKGQAGSATKGQTLQNVTLHGELVDAPAGSAAKGESVLFFKVTRAVGPDGEIAMLKDKVLKLSEKGKGAELLKAHQKGEQLMLRGNVEGSTGSVEVLEFEKDSTGPSRGSASKPGSGSK